MAVSEIHREVKQTLKKTEIIPLPTLPFPWPFQDAASDYGMMITKTHVSALLVANVTIIFPPH